MSEKERESFFRGAVSRPAGKRQIKPSNAFFETDFHQLLVADNDGDEDEDLDFTEKDQSNSDVSSSEEESENEDDSKSGYESGSESEEVDDEIDSKDKDIATTSSAQNKIQGNGIIGINEEDNIDKLEQTTSEKICSICLDLKQSDRLGELIQCDRCGIRVHESCYGMAGELTSEGAQSTSSSASTEPWFCEPCLLGNGTMPHCELCPSRFGAFKRTDIQGCWVHLICALFTPGITFSEPDRLSGINWDDIDRNFGRKSCAGCNDRLESRVGITVRCDAGLCKNYFHVSCAQRLGLLVENPNHRSSLSNEAGYLYCKSHNHNENLIIKQKLAYKKFIKQEDYRVVEFKKINLDHRQEKKWRLQLEERLKQIDLAGAASSTDLLQKKAKFLHTRAKYLNGFVEKAEILGMNRKQFEGEFMNIPSFQLTIGLPPAFSKAFIGYVEYREANLFEEEENKLKRNKQLKDEFLKNQLIVEEELRNVRMERDELSQKCSNQDVVYDKLKTIMREIAPSSIEESTKKKIDRKRSLPKMQNTKTGIDTIEEKRTKKTDDGKKLSMTILETQLSPSLFTKFGFNDKQPKMSSTIAKTQQLDKINDNEISSTLIASNSKSISPVGIQGPLECKKCKKANDLHLLIFCETCKHNYHINCLDPPLERMPVKNKFSRFECSDCADDDRVIDEVEPGSEVKATLPEDWKLSTMRKRRKT